MQEVPSSICHIDMSNVELELFALQQLEDFIVGYLAVGLLSDDVQVVTVTSAR